MRLSTILTLLITFPALCFARPLDLQESTRNPIFRIARGVGSAFTDVLAFLGYYDEEEKDMDRKRYPPTKIQVVVLGLGRTGTTSLASAMELLNYTVFHDDEHAEASEEYEKYEDDDEKFHEILGYYGYNVSFKTHAEWAERHQDEIKIIWTVRDSPEQYAESWLVAAPFIDILQRPPFKWLKRTKRLLNSMKVEYLEEPTDGEPDKYLDKETLIQTYIDYNEEVKEMFKSENLLIFNVKQGWGPLCEFLGVEVPKDTPFPHVHDRLALQGEMYVLRIFTWIWPLVFIIPIVLVYGIVKLCLRYKSKQE